MRLSRRSTCPPGSRHLQTLSAQGCRSNKRTHFVEAGRGSWYMSRCSIKRKELAICELMKYGGISMGVDVRRAEPRERRLRGFPGREESYQDQRQHGISHLYYKQPRPSRNLLSGGLRVVGCPRLLGKAVAAARSTLCLCLCGG